MGMVRSGAIDAAILATAGVLRLGRADEIDAILPTSSFLPAPAQGALAVVARAGNRALASIVLRIDHPATHLSIRAERAFAAALGGDCHVPLGALASCRGGKLSLVGEVLSPDGRMSLRHRRRGSASDAERIGTSLGKEMLKRGALDIVPPTRR
jgi:hydroxymethylbilane synthase